MPREFKLRAWIKRHSKMVEVHGIDFKEKYIWHENLRENRQGDLEPVAETDPDCVSTFEQIELMRSIGLSDRNGRSIYEGDILRNHWTLLKGQDSGHTWIVKFGAYTSPGTYEGVEVAYGFYVEKLFAASYDEEREKCILTLPYDGENRLPEGGLMLRVIGNIYENPELLK